MTTALLAVALLACSDAPAPCVEDVPAWRDDDGDGFGGESLGKVCELGEGEVDVPGDCDDTTDQLSPVAFEECDGIDNDCDGQVDDGGQQRQYWFDHDGDGFGGLFRSELACGDPGDGWVRNADDCDDDDPAVNPDAREVCGRLDEDCDGYVDDWDDSVDPDTFSVFFADDDGDGFGDEDETIEQCRLSPGYVVNANDCNDRDAAITWVEYWTDADGDGYGDPGTLEHACRNAPPGTVDNDLDCDDADASLTYESDWFVDVDGDGWGSGLSLAFDCVPPDPDAVNQGGDCDENDVVENPGALEDCSNFVDDNCNGRIDAEDSDCLPPCADDVLETSAGGTTVGQSNSFNPNCNFAATNAGDVAYAFTAPTAGLYTFDLLGSSYDTLMAIYDGCGGIQLGCNDDAYGIGSPSRVSVSLAAGQTVIVDVDGWNLEEGNYQLEVY